MTGPLLALKDSGLAPKSTEDCLSGLQEDLKDFADLKFIHQESSSEDANKLDDYLDQLLEEEFGEYGKDILDESVSQPEVDSSPSASETLLEDELDLLFHSLIAEEDTTGSKLSPKNNQKDKDLDVRLDEIFLNNFDEEKEVEPMVGFDETQPTLKSSEPLTIRKKIIDESVANPIGDEEQEIKTPKPQILSPGNHVIENSDVEDLLAEFSSEDKTLSRMNQEKQSKETFFLKQSANQQEKEKYNEDLWAEDFENQKTVKVSTEDVDLENRYGDTPETIGQNEEESSSPEKKKFPFFTLLSTKTGKLVVGSGILAVLLTGGGTYFVLQTLAPPELTQMTKNTSDFPEGLIPKEPQNNSASQNQPGNASAENPDLSLTTPLGAGEAPALAKNPGKPDKILPHRVKSNSGASKGLVSALVPGNHTVQLATIILAVYDINSIKVLSFSLKAEMSDAESAQVIREAMLMYKKITITTVEQLMDKKFFDDILYVKEKLKRNLLYNFNKTLEGGGRVKKIILKDFTVK